ncbi:MAG: hypothetical protein H6818_02240 [Phycisphaerales bacterium]|nr:hypothetical protein [Phycisphaerales bacterium]MCB9863133.1 hypothetical protein [Phycisphaerales bacterium]
MTEPREQPTKDNDPADAQAAGRDPLVEIADQLADLKSTVADLVEVRIDQARFWLRNAAFSLLVLTIVWVAAAALVVMAAVWIACGAALGLTDLLGGRIWAGYLAAGIVIPMSMACAAWIWNSLASNRRKRQLLAKYNQQSMGSGEVANPSGNANHEHTIGKSDHPS